MADANGSEGTGSQSSAQPSVGGPGGLSPTSGPPTMMLTGGQASGCQQQSSGPFEPSEEVKEFHTPMQSAIPPHYELLFLTCPFLVSNQEVYRMTFRSWPVDDRSEGALSNNLLSPVPFVLEITNFYGASRHVPCVDWVQSIRADGTVCVTELSFEINKDVQVFATSATVVECKHSSMVRFQLLSGKIPLLVDSVLPIQTLGAFYLIRDDEDCVENFDDSEFLPSRSPQDCSCIDLSPAFKDVQDEARKQELCQDLKETLFRHSELQDVFVRDKTEFQRRVQALQADAKTESAPSHPDMSAVSTASLDETRSSTTDSTSDENSCPSLSVDSRQPIAASLSVKDPANEIPSTGQFTDPFGVECMRGHSLAPATKFYFHNTRDTFRNNIVWYLDDKEALMRLKPHPSVSGYASYDPKQPYRGYYCAKCSAEQGGKVIKPIAIVYYDKRERDKRQIHLKKEDRDIVAPVLKFILENAPGNDMFECVRRVMC